MAVYNQNFDELSSLEKSRTVITFLKLLPTVKEMRSHILEQRNTDGVLQKWIDRISPAALGILRWIIASNRSCIFQVDKCPGQTEEDAIQSGVRLDHKIPGIDGWVQFRFAQGAPDKEARFLKCWRDNQKKLALKYPTIFAWHGSSLHNWHSIIRSGLDFTQTINGRAFGHGCYHSQDFRVSEQYSGIHKAVSVLSHIITSTQVAFFFKVPRDDGIYTYFS